MPSSLEDLLARLGGDAELLREVAGIFVEDVPKQIARLRHAVAAANAVEIAAAAHGLKGSISNFETAEAFDLAASMEVAARLNHLDDMSADFQRLEERLDGLIALLKTC